MTQPWEDFGAIGATTSSGSGHSRALSVDSALGILPFPYALGSDNPKAACFRIRGLVGTRAAYIQSILRDAGRRYPLSGSHTRDYFMASGFLNGELWVACGAPART